jgi:hypothetical protein
VDIWFRLFPERHHKRTYDQHNHTSNFIGLHPRSLCAMMALSTSARREEMPFRSTWTTRAAGALIVIVSMIVLQIQLCLRASLSYLLDRLKQWFKSLSVHRHKKRLLHLQKRYSVSKTIFDAQHLETRRNKNCTLSRRTVSSKIILNNCEIRDWPRYLRLLASAVAMQYNRVADLFRRGWTGTQ